MSIGTLLIRADASVAIGTGHVMRCLALAQAWQDGGGRAVFVAAEMSAGLVPRLQTEKMQLFQLAVLPGSHQDCDQTSAIANRVTANWIVLDGPVFSFSYMRDLRKAAPRVMVFDDEGIERDYSADIIVNQNWGASEDAYQNHEMDCELLLGTEFVLLRREFHRWVDWRREASECRQRVLISMGGSDPDNLTLRAIQAITALDTSDFEVTVLRGGGSPHYLPDRKIKQANFHVQQDTQGMALLLKDSDTAIIAGGGTLWEALFMQCAVLSYVRSTVQRKIITGLAGEGAVLYLDPAQTEDVTETLRTALHSRDIRRVLSRRGREVVDGLGTKRVLERMLAKTKRN